jgi:hypothetical protein
MKRVAVIGDVHGCLDELKQLYGMLCHFSLDEIRVAGDLVDRGPDSGGVVRFCREKGIPAVLGNHEDSVLAVRKRLLRGDPNVNKGEKYKTNMQLTEDDANWLRALPKIHYYENLNLLVAHGGIWPKLEMWQQPLNVIRAQMIKPLEFGMSKWWGKDATVHGGKTEEQLKEMGWARWYDIYDGPWNVVYGHSVFAQPHIQQNPGAGMTIGIDTGSCFGGMLTALIWDEKQTPSFVSVKVRENYAKKEKVGLDQEKM